MTPITVIIFGVLCEECIRDQHQLQTILLTSLQTWHPQIRRTKEFGAEPTKGQSKVYGKRRVCLKYTDDV